MLRLGLIIEVTSFWHLSCYRNREGSRCLHRNSRIPDRICTSWYCSLGSFRPSSCIWGTVWIWPPSQNQWISDRFCQSCYWLCIRRRSSLRGICTCISSSNVFCRQGTYSYLTLPMTQRQLCNLQWGTMKSSCWLRQKHWMRIFHICPLSAHRWSCICRWVVISCCISRGGIVCPICYLKSELLGSHWDIRDGKYAHTTKFPSLQDQYHNSKPNTTNPSVLLPFSSSFVLYLLPPTSSEWAFNSSTRLFFSELISTTFWP